MIRNQDQKSKDYEDIKDVFRPSHADYVYSKKYGFRDYRGGGRSSARETAMRVAAGAIAKKYLNEKLNIKIKGYLSQIGALKITAIDFDEISNNPFFCPDVSIVSDIEHLIDTLRKEGDSTGAKIEVYVMNLPVGLGEPVFDKLEADLAKALMSINAVKGFEVGRGFGFEYLYFKQDSNYAIGFEVFEVKKRDYEMRFGSLDYKNITGHLNFYYRNYGRIPFDAKISYGEYLAGDEGITIDLSRSFENGTKFGIFASFTDVSTDQFGEGSFDKGIYFNIPVFGNLINYSWRPLTKDPGAKLNRKNTLHDLLIRFRPIN